MKALSMIVNSPSPIVNPYADWSPEFKLFVRDCLEKNPDKRIKAKDILYKHKKFFEKSQGGSYLVYNLVQKLKPLETRIAKKVTVAGEEYLNSKYKQQA